MIILIATVQLGAGIHAFDSRTDNGERPQPGNVSRII
jgi:hypothetical protein